MVFLRSLAVIMLFFMIVLGSCSRLEGSMLNRSIFPASFVFGTAAAAYQYEGGATEGGKGPSIWDTFTHKHPDKITDGSNGDVAVEFYHRYKEDVSIMKNMGMDAYRFSFSWPRILPNGTLSGGVNKEGVAYYNNLINELVSNGLQPFVTLFHWDTPQAIEDQYGSFLSRAIVKDYRDYAETCFREFGDRVKHWITFNEPLVFSVSGYAQDSFPPGRCSSCSKGDSGREPYIAGHHQLLAHAATVKLYRAKFQASQKGKIGISLNTQWIMPLSNSKSNGDAAARALDFTYGWFLDPLTQGDYPFSMRALVGDRLPKFTQKQSRELKGSFDFLGINYYTTNYAFAIPFSNIIKKSVFLDSYANTTGVRDGIPIGPVAASRWLYSYPRGLRDLLKYTKDKYNNPIIYITENGVDEINNGTLPLNESLKDEARIEYHRSHLLYLHRAIREGVDVRGYFAWSLLDNFEWTSGFTVRFGLNYVDYKDGLKRYPKSSAIWFRKFLQK